ncbi:MAG: potassium-transporting ATPase subunit C [Candidatus Aminicenantes bacterium]|nr:potassium-transporting ATPase subunit C [Candidatus Aminicenantes bacterium]
MIQKKGAEWIRETAASLRIAAVSLVVLGGIYPVLLGGLGKAVVPSAAAGWLVRDAAGAVVGSALMAQKFSRPEYFWPRPSAVDFNASAAGGSNLPPGSPDLAARVKARIAELGGTTANPVPVDLLAASGSGLDPHITLAGAEFQIDRVAAARRLEPAILRDWLRAWSRARREGRGQAPLVNVLGLNRTLDERFGRPPVAAAPARKEAR